MKSRLVPAFVGLIISLIIIGAQTAKANVIRLNNITSISATADIQGISTRATTSLINDIRIEETSSASEIDQHNVIDAGAAIGTIETRRITSIGKSIENIDSIDINAIPVCEIERIAITVDNLIVSAGVING